MVENAHRICEDLSFFIRSAIDIGNCDFVNFSRSRTTIAGWDVAQTNGVSFFGFFEGLHSTN